MSNDQSSLCRLFIIIGLITPSTRLHSTAGMQTPPPDHLFCLSHHHHQYHHCTGKQNCHHYHHWQAELPHMTLTLGFHFLLRSRWRLGFETREEDLYAPPEIRSLTSDSVHDQDFEREFTQETRSSEMNIAPDINNHLRSIDHFRSMIT